MDTLSLIRVGVAACVAVVFAGCEHDDGSEIVGTGTGAATACPTGLLACDGRCVDPSADATNCGGCGKVCAGGELCRDAACVLTCGAGLAKCADPQAGLGGAYCSDLESDRENCGACGVRCAAGQQCEAGACTTACAPGLTACADGKCHDLASDSGHCGACSTAAESHACVTGSACVEGTCGGTCSGTKQLCGDGSSHDVTSDAMNCGACSTKLENHACPAGARCVSGGCVLSCGAGESVCNDTCVALAGDVANCGFCGHACGGSEICKDGACSALGPFTGATSGAWITVASAPAGASDANYTDYTPPGGTKLFAAATGTSTLYALDLASGTWTTRATPPSPLAGRMYNGTAWVGGTIFGFAADRVMAYDVAGNTWSSPYPYATNAMASTLATHDDAGNVYAISQVGAVLVYSIGKKTLGTISTSFNAPSEPRIAYDATSKLLLVAPDFNASGFYAIDPAIGAQRMLAPPPDGRTSTMFCADRTGHLYVGGTPTTRQLWQYTVGSNTWKKIDPAPPFINANNGSCTVSHDGWLWYADGYGSIAKIALAR